MSRHNPVASKRRRLPYVAKIKRDDPFCPEDEREIQAMCRRIAAAGNSGPGCALLPSVFSLRLASA